MPTVTEGCKMPQQGSSGAQIIHDIRNDSMTSESSYGSANGAPPDEDSSSDRGGPPDPDRLDRFHDFIELGDEYRKRLSAAVYLRAQDIEASSGGPPLVSKGKGVEGRNPNPGASRFEQELERGKVELELLNSVNKFLDRHSAPAGLDLPSTRDVKPDEASRDKAQSSRTSHIDSERVHSLISGRSPALSPTLTKVTANGVVSTADAKISGDGRSSPAFKYLSTLASTPEIDPQGSSDMNGEETDSTSEYVQFPDPEIYTSENSPTGFDGNGEPPSHNHFSVQNASDYTRAGRLLTPETSDANQPNKGVRHNNTASLTTHAPIDHDQQSFSSVPEIIITPADGPSHFVHFPSFESHSRVPSSVQIEAVQDDQGGPNRTIPDNSEDIFPEENPDKPKHRSPFHFFTRWQAKTSARNVDLEAQINNQQEEQEQDQYQQSDVTTASQWINRRQTLEETPEEAALAREIARRLTLELYEQNYHEHQRQKEFERLRKKFSSPAKARAYRKYLHRQASRAPPPMPTLESIPELVQEAALQPIQQPPQEPRTRWQSVIKAIKRNSKDTFCMPLPFHQRVLFITGILVFFGVLIVLCFVLAPYWTGEKKFGGSG
ncbi:uncharacterized protein F4822DRAFT_425316 [Hypoxylon trugodes]|uniref:uncharacterized protein n=1 Tax=Hypoxylon trugodes TaxID=326681 RepID=UPI0021A0AB25|nr:uncharacterized protein F4822DRAFT_425316 [Hypoxylon trugodes]KAI1392099.1 hypothetical protein F4822DRAFT_425316 [Hypoxylon trugodes]